MTHYKRGRAKNQRAGCLLCKPHKANGEKGTEGAQTMQERKARGAERSDAYAAEPYDRADDFDDDDPDNHERNWEWWLDNVVCPIDYEAGEELLFLLREERDQ